MKTIYNFEIAYSIKALTEKSKWIEKVLKDSKTTIIASSEEIARIQMKESFQKEEDVEIIIEKIEQLPYNKIYQLQEWANAHEPKETMIYKNAYWKQIIFIRDTITSILAKDYEHYKSIRDNIKVINTHVSKSIGLPVYYIELDDITFILRDNFYDWKVSVISNKKVDCDFQGLFKDENISNVYCEGFPREFVYEKYSDNKGSFTVELDSDYKLFTFMFLIKNWIDNFNNIKINS